MSGERKNDPASAELGTRAILGAADEPFSANGTSGAISQFGGDRQDNRNPKDDFIKIGDMVFFFTEDADESRKPEPPEAKQTKEHISGTHFLFGEPVQGRVKGKPKTDNKIEAEFLGAIFRVQTKYDYVAQRALAKDRKQQESADPSTIARLTERAERERQQNEEEDRHNAGNPIYYGQTIQLVHVSSGQWLYADKSERAEVNSSSLKVRISKEGSKNNWFKVMPRFRVRFEGEKVRRGDQVCVIHVKSGQYLHLDSLKFPNEQDKEVNLYNEQTGWIVNHFAAYIPHSEKFVKVRQRLITPRHALTHSLPLAGVPRAAVPRRPRSGTSPQRQPHGIDSHC